MGQAKARGTLEQRIEQAQQRRMEQERATMLGHHNVAVRMEALAKAIRERGLDAVAAEATELRGMVQ